MATHAYVVTSKVSWDIRVENFGIVVITPFRAILFHVYDRATTIFAILNYGNDDEKGGGDSGAPRAFPR